MAKIAIIATGGKQYKVKEGETIKVEKLEVAAGEKIKFNTLLIADTDGNQLEVGKPSLGDKVSAEVIDAVKEKKVKVVKYKSKIRYKRNVGHRQLKTAVKILSIA